MCNTAFSCFVQKNGSDISATPVPLASGERGLLILGWCEEDDGMSIARFLRYH